MFVPIICVPFRRWGVLWNTCLCSCSTTCPPLLSTPRRFTATPRWSLSAKYLVVRPHTWALPRGWIHLAGILLSSHVRQSVSHHIVHPASEPSFIVTLTGKTPKKPDWYNPGRKQILCLSYGFCVWTFLLCRLQVWWFQSLFCFRWASRDLDFHRRRRVLVCDGARANLWRSHAVLQCKRQQTGCAVQFNSCSADPTVHPTGRSHGVTLFAAGVQKHTCRSQQWLIKSRAGFCSLLWLLSD